MDIVTTTAIPSPSRPLRTEDRPRSGRTADAPRPQRVRSGQREGVFRGPPVAGPLRTGTVRAQEYRPAPRRFEIPAASDWLFWQLADSAFPTGGFAHSAGLEAAWQHGEVRNSADFISFAQASLQQLGRAALPFLNAAHAEPQRLAEFDQHCDAFTSNHVANRASRLQGKALRVAVERIFSVSLERGCSQPRHSHLAPVFGAVTRALDVPHAGAVRLFVFIHVRSVIAAAMRLNVVGPMEGQAIQFQLSAQAEAVAQRGATLGMDDLAQTAPLLDLWQGAHDRLYSRLFQS